MRQKPEFDLRLQYPMVIEASATISLAFVILLVVGLPKKFEPKNIGFKSDIQALKVEEIPITRPVKKIEIPVKPTIPIDDPDVSIDEKIDMPDIKDFENMIKPPPPPPDLSVETVPFWKVEKPPVILGGNEAIQKYIFEHKLFPELAAETKVPGKVRIGYTVKTDGTTSDVKVLNEYPLNFGFGEAGVKVMQAMRFQPGMQSDKLIQVSMEQTITFAIE